MTSTVWKSAQQGRLPNCAYYFCKYSTTQKSFFEKNSFFFVSYAIIIGCSRYFDFSIFHTSLRHGPRRSSDGNWKVTLLNLQINTNPRIVFLMTLYRWTIEIVIFWSYMLNRYFSVDKLVFYITRIIKITLANWTRWG